MNHKHSELPATSEACLDLHNCTHCLIDAGYCVYIKPHLCMLQCCFLQLFLITKCCASDESGSGGGCHRGSHPVDTRLTWSLSVCLLWVRGDTREGQAVFVAKTIKVMVRVAPSHRGASGEALCNKDLKPANTACTHAK